MISRYFYRFKNNLRHIISAILKLIEIKIILLKIDYIITSYYIIKSSYLEIDYIII